MKTTILFVKVLLLVSLMMCTGCGTCVAWRTRNNSESGWFGADLIPKGAYSGVKTDAVGAALGVVSPVPFLPLTPFAVADMPLSAIGDTCMLPYYLK